ncbi:MAG: hypothetical protein WA960_06805 [Tunicatimonas sp.]
MIKNNVLSAFLLFLLLAATHRGNSQENVKRQKLILPDLSGSDIWQSMEAAPLTFVLYASNDVERQLLRWKNELESFQRRGVLVLLLTEDEQTPGMKVTPVGQPASATGALPAGQDFRAANHLPPTGPYTILLDENQMIIARADANLPDSPARFLDMVVNRTPNDLRTLRFADPPTPIECPGIENDPWQ